MTSRTIVKHELLLVGLVYSEALRLRDNARPCLSKPRRRGWAVRTYQMEGSAEFYRRSHNAE